MTDRPVIYLDIETTGTESDRIMFHAKSKITAPKNYTDQKKIEAYIERKHDEVWNSTATKGYQGRIACIGVAIGTDSPEILYAEDEATTIRSFLKFVKRITADAYNRPPMFCGFNVRWDLRFIWQRALVNGVELNGTQLWETSKRWDTNNVLDLYWRLSCGEDHASGGLKDWCLALDIETGADDIDGAEVPEAWLDDLKRKLVLEHCIKDVARCQQIHQRLMELGIGV